MSNRGKNTASSEHGLIADQASLWLAKRDRGLTGAEQDEYLRWLGADPRHAEIMQQHAAALERMMQLYEWQPGQSAEANPDLFAPPRRSTRSWRWAAPLAAAAAMMLAAAYWWPGKRASEVVPGARSSVAVLRVNELQTLPDGSIVELKDGGRLELAYSGRERRVLLNGEAHFTVAKSPVPFVVRAANVSVRAVGTAFNVKTTADTIDVLVTEGRVAVAADDAGLAHGGAAPPDGAKAPDKTNDTSPRLPAIFSETVLVAGQQAVVSSARPEVHRVRNVTRAEIEMALSWKVPRLQFVETPLSTAIEEFNRRNRVQLVLGQRELATIPIGGTFRIDNVDGFVRLLEITLDIRAVRRGDRELVLSREP